MAGNDLLSESDKDIPLPLDKLRTIHPSHKRGQTPQPIVLVSTGSFNPPTILHLRMFELARDELTADGYDVLGGYVSPVNDAYGKKGLAPGRHRVEMCQMAVAESDLIMVDPWEAAQSGYQRTISVLKRVEEQVNAARPAGEVPVRAMLLCGADLLESFRKPGVWIESQLREIFANHGVVCISRAGSDARRHIEESDLLFAHRRKNLLPPQKFIRVVDEWVSNEVSSTIVRRFLSRGRSVKYLTPDGVINYVKEHGLYTGPSPERGTVNESKPSSLKDTADVQSNGATVSARSS